MFFDAHSDFGLQAYRELLQGNEQSLVESHYKALKKGDVKVEVVTVGGDFTFDNIDFRDPAIVLKTIQTIKKQIVTSDNKFTLIQTSNDFTKVESSDSIGIILGLEGASPIQPSQMTIQNYYDEGVRSVILTSNETNEYSGGCASPLQGLTPSGIRLIEEINRLPMAIDLSHISETAFFQVANLTQKPLFVSHANVKSLSDHFRNLSDEQIKLIQKRSGVIGLSLISLFIDIHEPVRVSLDRFIDHIEYITTLCGIGFVGIGADFMDYLEDIFVPFFQSKGFPPTITTYPHTINSVSDINLIFKEMQNRKFSALDIQKVSYSNFATFFKNQLA